MQFIERSSLSNAEKLEIIELWNKEYPAKLSFKSGQDFEDYLNQLTEPSHLLFLDQNKEIKGWYCDFMRGNEKWFAILLDSEIQGKGIGTKMLALAKQKENELNGWVIDHNRDKRKNGKFYYSPLGFYLKNGFKKLTKNRLESDKISAVKIIWRKGYNT